MKERMLTGHALCLSNRRDHKPETKKKQCVARVSTQLGKAPRLQHTRRAWCNLESTGVTTAHASLKPSSVADRRVLTNITIEGQPSTPPTHRSHHVVLVVE